MILCYTVFSLEAEELNGMDHYKTLKDHVYDYISNQILEGQLGIKEKINENEISEALSVSRTPIREALIQLSCEGFLDCIPRKGFLLNGITEKQAEDLYCVIGDLDALAARLAIDHLTENDYMSMDYHIQSMDYAIASDNYQLYLEHQNAFHEVYLLKCDNEFLTDTLVKLKNRLFTRGFTKKPDTSRGEFLDGINREHREILRLFREGQVEQVANYIANVHWTPIHAHNEVLK